MSAGTTSRRAGGELARFRVGGRSVTPVTSRCPSCGGSDPETVWDGFRTNRLCHYCGGCTHIGPAEMWTVDPSTCHGCQRRSRCLATLGPSRRGTPSRSGRLPGSLAGRWPE